MSRLKTPVPLYEDIRALVLSARQTIARGVDLLQVHTNYEIGRRIFEQEQHGADRAECGKELLNELAARLTAEFGAGFSRTNLVSMRQFYVTYPDRVSRIVQTPSGQFKVGAIPQMLSGEVPIFPIVQTLSGQSLDPRTQPQPAFTLSWSHTSLESTQCFYPHCQSGMVIEKVHQGLDWNLPDISRVSKLNLPDDL